MIYVLNKHISLSMMILQNKLFFLYFPAKQEIIFVMSVFVEFFVWIQYNFYYS